MSGRRTPFASGIAMALVCAMTTWVALCSWGGFLETPADYLMPALVLAGAIAIAGAALRHLGSPWIVVLLVQATCASLIVTREITGDLLPVGDGLQELRAALAAAVDSARTYAAPVGDDVASIAPLLVLGGAAFLLLVDAIACTWRKVPLAGLGLLAIYALPAGLTEAGPHWAPFVAAAIGYLTMLHLDAREELSRWGRSLGPDEHNPWTSGSGVGDAVRAGALRIGAGATALALAAPLVVPVLDVDLLGIGSGGGGGEIKIRKPRADLRRDLERGEDIPLLRVETDDPDPGYLRIGVLNRFTGSEWSSGDRDVSSDQDADRDLPLPRGLSPEVPITTYDYRVEVTEAFDSTWLPTQFPISAISAEGEWRYDDDTYDFLGVDDQNAAGISYQMTAIEPDFGTDGRWFANPSSAAVSSEVMEIPGGLPSLVRNLAVQVTEGAVNDYERARLLQSWFRNDGGFRYSVRKAPPGSIGQTLATFLSDAPGGRIGYCEQFAASMAIMARIVGIPARVAVGFLEATPVGTDEWEYSSHDLHAWPELYFEGSGWVPFEPTPGRRAETAPDYTTVPVQGRPDIAPTTNPSQQPSASAQPTARPTDPGPTAAPENADAEGTSSRGGAADDAARWALIAGVPLLLIGAALTPRALRRRLRERRLSGDAEEQWSEVRASACDLRISWPAGRSPRETGSAIETYLARGGSEASEELRTAIDDLVTALERRRYARDGGIAVATRETSTSAATVIAEMTASVTPRSRRRAQWLPASLWKR